MHMARHPRTWMAIGTLGVVALVSGACGGSAAPGTATALTTVPASAAPATTTPTSKPTFAPTPAAPATPVTALDVTSTIDGFSGAVDVAATGDAVWVLDHSDSSLWPIDPATATLGKPIDVASSGGATYLELVDGLLW